MFSYGENNVLDFTKLNGIYGMFAFNRSGKSALMDAMCFTIFDKTARTFKAGHVMNYEKTTFHGKFTFEIADVQYVIERKGVRDKKNNVKDDVNFYVKSGERGWNELGSYHFSKGNYRVELSDESDGFIIADAVKWTKK